jgi:RNA polymerase sigma-70 factor (ECF subfamily)
MNSGTNTDTASSSSPAQTSPDAAGSLYSSARFLTTHWSVVCAAGDINSTCARTALAKVCRTYWYPLYAYVRQRGYTPADAQDLTQAFFAQLLASKSLREIRPEGGKFRSFLLVAMKHFLIDEWRKLSSQKRGAGRVISLDAHDAETRFQREPVDTLTPERLFEQNWALALLETVYTRLQTEYQSAGKGGLFDTLRFCLTGERSAVPYAQLAAQLHMPENTVKTLVRRLRARYRQLLREEVAHGLTDPRQVEEELRSLFLAVAGS